MKTVLEVAIEKHPNLPIVYSRWSDYYLKINHKPNAIKSNGKSLKLDPTDQQTKGIFSELTK